MDAREEEELRECTFRPRINPSSARYPRVGTVVDPAVKAYARSAAVAERLEEERAAREARELDGCTFAPDLHGDKHRLKARKEALVAAIQVESGEPEGTPGGFDKTVARMRAAREAREAKAKQLEPRSYDLNAPGAQPLRLRVTQPRPPRLATGSRGSPGYGYADAAVDPGSLIQMLDAAAAGLAA